MIHLIEKKITSNQDHRYFNTHYKATAPIENRFDVKDTILNTSISCGDIRINHNIKSEQIKIIREALINPFDF